MWTIILNAFMKNTLYGGIKMIEVKNLTKCYAAHKAIDNISFTVNDGEILGKVSKKIIAQLPHCN